MLEGAKHRLRKPMKDWSGAGAVMLNPHLGQARLGGVPLQALLV